MGSVRSRLEAEERAKQEAANPERDFVPPTSRSLLVVGNAPTMSTRERKEMAAAQEPEVLRPVTRQGVSGAFNEVNAPMSLREREERQAALAQVNAEQAQRSDTTMSAWEEYWLNRKREDDAKERKRKREQQERIAREQDQQKAEAERQLWVISVNTVFETLRATPAERARVLALPSVHVGMDADKVGGILLTLRDATRGKPDWAQNL